MRAPVFGAGVLGCPYAAKLHQTGHDVAVLARGQRAAEIRSYGVVLQNATTGAQTTTAIEVLEQLRSDDSFELIIVLVRKDQLASVLPVVQANQATPSVLFMVNNALGPDEMVQAVGAQRALFGLAGAGGSREGRVVRYHVLPARQQPTTLGELDGRRTPRLKQIGSALRQAGFPVTISGNIDAWLKTHVMWTCPAAHALYSVGGSNYSLAHDRTALLLWVRAVREGYRVLNAFGVPVTPRNLQVFEGVPDCAGGDPGPAARHTHCGARDCAARQCRTGGIRAAWQQIPGACPNGGGTYSGFRPAAAVHRSDDTADPECNRRSYGEGSEQSLISHLRRWSHDLTS